MSETTLLRLRAEMARIANEIEGLADLTIITNKLSNEGRNV